MPTASKKLKSVQVVDPTHRKLQQLKAASGVSITRLIDQAVESLVMTRKRKRKPSI